ncbi:hypothetical protein [Longimicrobium sp.]|uniref:hypothetical protein n=1 Tax=Longimicrobium sp. TaxID=2029185 RepID=UPI002B844EE0|nr:hypothetical protein [Longimicrobium sp.]HSU17488.1 hypothetical protein [Longimicrobium sp.]
MNAAAPSSADALRGRLDVSDDARRHLVRVESEACELLTALDTRLAGGDPALAASAADLTGFLAGVKSPLLRALGRRGSDLDAGGLARRSLDHAWNAVRGRATRAIERHDVAVELERMLRRVRDRFSGRLPWHLARALDAAGVDEGTLRTRESAWLRARHERLQRVEEELAAAERRLPAYVDEPLEVKRWPDAVSRAELAAAVEEADPSRAAGASPGRAEALRTLSARHLARLRGRPGAARPAPALDEIAARESVALVDAKLAPGTADLDAWGVLLRHAARNRAPSPADPSSAAEPREPAPASTLYVVPLFGPYVLIRMGDGWPVQVRGRGVRCGVRAECVAAVPPRADAVAVDPAAWAGPLFDLPADPGGYWLETGTPAVVLPFARISADRWLAEVVARGTLRVGATPAWERLPRRSRASVRILAPAGAVAGNAVLATGKPVRTEQAFGCETRVVPLPLRDLTHGWLRTASTEAGERAVRHEHAFFRALETRTTGRSPRCLGRPARGPGYLYAPPVALPLASSAALRAWRDQDPRALVAAAARLWRELSVVGLGLGMYHPAAIGYRVAGGPFGSAAALHAVALAAPLGTLLGRPYRAAPAGIPPLDRLGRLPPHPAQAAGTPASRETEAALFAVYALDLLAEAPLESVPEQWEDLVARLSAPQRTFREPEVAAGLVDGLAAGASGDLVLRVAALAGQGEALIAAG